MHVSWILRILRISQKTALITKNFLNSLSHPLFTHAKKGTEIKEISLFRETNTEFDPFKLLFEQKVVLKLVLTYFVVFNFPTYFYLFYFSKKQT